MGKFRLTTCGPSAGPGPGVTGLELLDKGPIP